MTKTPSINDLWRNEECPLVEGVIFDDGTILEFSITHGSSERLIFDLARVTDIKEILEREPDNVKCLYHSKLTKTHGPHLYMADEGSWGGDGYVACLDLKTKDLLWVFTSDKINPIVELDFIDGKVIAKNNLQSVFSLDIKYPDQEAIINQ